MNAQQARNLTQQIYETNPQAIVDYFLNKIHNNIYNTALQKESLLYFVINDKRLIIKNKLNEVGLALMKRLEEQGFKVEQYNNYFVSGLGFFISWEKSI